MDLNLIKQYNFLYPFKQQTRSKLGSKLQSKESNILPQELLPEFTETFQTARARGGKSTISSEENTTRVRYVKSKVKSQRNGLNVINMLDFDNQ